MADNKVRYCSECGHIGNVTRPHRDCCPTSNATRVPYDTAVQAHAGFKAGVALHVAERMVYGSKGRQAVNAPEVKP